MLYIKAYQSVASSNAGLCVEDSNGFPFVCNRILSTRKGSKSLIIPLYRRVERTDIRWYICPGCLIARNSRHFNELSEGSRPTRGPRVSSPPADQSSRIIQTHYSSLPPRAKLYSSVWFIVLLLLTSLRLQHDGRRWLNELP